MNDYKETYQRGLRSKGFELTTAASGATTERITLDGQKGILLGFGLETDSNFNSNKTIVSFEINNDLVVNRINAKFAALQPDNPRLMVPLERAISGNDTIDFTVNSNQLQQGISLIVYYRNL